jgi:hypothetical protein
MAVALGLGSLAVLGSGWWVSLKTRYRVAGQALTFLGCVIAPLNLWFYHAQGLITLDHHLWVGGLVCVLFYVGTVFVLRDPLFMYAVEAGATLTVLLLMAELHTIRDVASFSMFCWGSASFRFTRSALSLLKGHLLAAASDSRCSGAGTLNWVWHCWRSWVRRSWDGSPALWDWRGPATC